MERITSLSHPLVKHLAKLRKDRSYRYECQSALVQGRKLAAELSPKVLLTTDPDETIRANERYLVTPHIIEKISSMQSPEGVLAEVPMADLPLHSPKKLLALDAISDPGNLGVLLRTALAFGWDGVFLLPGCCDPYNDKALTAARGATFKIPLLQGSWKELAPLTKNFKRLAAHMEGTSPSKQERVLLVLGNEAHGPTTETLSLCEPVHIPISPDMESLNVAVAGGILLYLL